MKTADELFKELGYEKEDDNEHYTITFKKQEKPFIVYKIIRFHLDIKEIIAKSDKNVSRPMTMQELKAINKKIKELGWV